MAVKDNELYLELFQPYHAYTLCKLWLKLETASVDLPDHCLLSRLEKRKKKRKLL